LSMISHSPVLCNTITVDNYDDQFQVKQNF
jgi:hypothetical protein